MNNIQTVIYVELILLFFELRLEHGYQNRAIKDTNKGQLESFLKNFTAIFGVTLFWGKQRIMGILQVIIALKEVCVKKEFSRSSLGQSIARMFWIEA